MKKAEQSISTNIKYCKKVDGQQKGNNSPGAQKDQQHHRAPSTASESQLSKRVYTAKRDDPARVNAVAGCQTEQHHSMRSSAQSCLPAQTFRITAPATDEVLPETTIKGHSAATNMATERGTQQLALASGVGASPVSKACSQCHQQAAS
jgi:hypothetical protein